MKTAMQETSLEAYFSDVLPDINEKQRSVLRVFMDNPAMNFTNMELAEDLGWSINRVTPRVYELRGCDKRFPLREAIIVESERRSCRETKFKAISWQLNPYWRSGGYKIE